MKKTILFTIIILFLGCKTTIPKVNLTISDKYNVILKNNKKLNGFWAIKFPFEIDITNSSHKDREFTYYKYQCFPYNECNRGILYLINNNKLIKQGIGKVKIIGSNEKKQYVMYSVHLIDTLKYPRSMFKEYYQKLKESGLQDSLPIGTLAEFKQKHPKLVADLLKNDSIYFRFPFPKRDKEKGYAQGVRVPVKW